MVKMIDEQLEVMSPSAAASAEAFLEVQLAIERAGGTKPAWVVLREDIYEVFLNGGDVRRLERAFWTADEAFQWVREEARRMTNWYVRQVMLGFGGRDRLNFRDIVAVTDIGVDLGLGTVITDLGEGGFP